MPVCAFSASGLQAYADFNSFSHSEPTAISALGSDWDQKLYPGEVAFSVNRFEVGINWKQWKVGVIQRYETYEKFSSDTAEALYRVERRELKVGEQYAVQLSSNTLEAGGLRIAYLQPVGQFNVGLGVSYLVGRNFIDGAGLTGTAQVISDKDYNLNFDIDYLYSEDKIFAREAPSPEGQGYAIDFTADWQPGQQWFFKLDVMDLRAQIKWRGALRTIAAADTNTKEFDADGYVVFNPVASGIETTQQYTQVIPRKIFFKMAYNTSVGYPVLFEYDDYKLKRFVSIGSRYSVNKASQMRFFYNATAKAFKLAYENQWLNFEIISDDFNVKKARTFGFRVLMFYEF